MVGNFSSFLFSDATLVKVQFRERNVPRAYQNWVLTRLPCARVDRRMLRDDHRTAKVARLTVRDDRRTAKDVRLTAKVARHIAKVARRTPRDDHRTAKVARRMRRGDHRTAKVARHTPRDDHHMAMVAHCTAKVAHQTAKVDRCMMDAHRLRRDHRITRLIRSITARRALLFLWVALSGRRPCLMRPPLPLFWDPSQALPVSWARHPRFYADRLLQSPADLLQSPAVLLPRRR